MQHLLAPRCAQQRAGCFAAGGGRQPQLRRRYFEHVHGVTAAHHNPQQRLRGGGPVHDDDRPSLHGAVRVPRTHAHVRRHLRQRRRRRHQRSLRTQLWPVQHGEPARQEGGGGRGWDGNSGSGSGSGSGCGSCSVAISTAASVRCFKIKSKACGFESLSFVHFPSHKLHLSTPNASTNRKMAQRKRK